MGFLKQNQRKAHRPSEGDVLHSIVLVLQQSETLYLRKYKKILPIREVQQLELRIPVNVWKQ